MSQISCHILDTACGCPATGLPVQLFQLDAKLQWVCLGQGCSDEDGRITNLLATGRQLPAGTYRVHFTTRDYFVSSGQTIFYPYVDVAFCISGDGQHYHIPLLLSPFGYSTYRGS